MKYRLPNEFIDMVDVASASKVDINRHNTAAYDSDELLKYVAGLYETNKYKVTDYNQVSNSYYNNPTEVYRVVKINFTDGGEITLFGERMKTPDDYVVVKKSDYEELTKKPEEAPKTEESKKADDEPINLDEIPF